MIKICPKCKDSHAKPGIFCSRTCANSRGIRSQQTKDKQSLANKDIYNKLSEDEKIKRNNRLNTSSPNFRSGPYTKIKLINCSGCHNEFWGNNLFTKGISSTCSDECFLLVKRRNKSGNDTIYNNEHYDSKWEADLALWLDEQNIKFNRPIIHIPWIDLNGKCRKYFPDFYIPELDLYVDPKNKFCIIDQKEKLDHVSKNIDLIYGELDYLKQEILNRFL